MADLSNRDRITFHDTLEMLEVDFSDKIFSSAADADAFYDEADRSLAATGRRWYFLINCTDCTIAPEAWERFAVRGKQTNIAHGLGTVRVGASEQTREAIRQQAGREMFRANMFATRDQAMLALGEMRKRKLDAGDATEGAFLRVESSTAYIARRPAP